MYEIFKKINSSGLKKTSCMLKFNVDINQQNKIKINTNFVFLKIYLEKFIINNSIRNIIKMFALSPKR
jgi:hypothetical protein